MDARRHVNRLCVAAGIPLVESGTAGYVGQVTVHLKGQTECYECNPRSNIAQKTYPICTLRNTPDKPIHCIVWAKELLFPRLFGKMEISDLDEASAQPISTAALEPAANPDAAAADGHSAAADAAARAAQAAAEEAAEAASFFTRHAGESELDYAVRVFDRLYNHDIQQVAGMKVGECQQTDLLVLCRSGVACLYQLPCFGLCFLPEWGFSVVIWTLNKDDKTQWGFRALMGCTSRQTNAKCQSLRMTVCRMCLSCLHMVLALPG
eukprot:GHRR01022694.1.p1 GENE.GHRR01022694.1~~GHRR01022694.1.p1  ORF type:complete len:265 (+),score=73.51 GHRR01022694.1:950-1744(+)